MARSPKTGRGELSAKEEARRLGNQALVWSIGLQGVPLPTSVTIQTLPEKKPDSLTIRMQRQVTAVELSGSWNPPTLSGQAINGPRIRGV
jgi:hypothetical protein